MSGRARRRRPEPQRPGPPCPTCIHEQRSAIDLALARGTESRAEIGRRYGLDVAALWRHAHGGHVEEALVEHAAASAAAAAESLLDRVVTLADRLDRRLADLEPDPRAKHGDVARLARELRGCLELVARVQGQLVERVELTYGRGRWADGDVVAVLDLLYAAVEPWPDAADAARAAVAIALAAEAVG